ncbi:hypothetical protein DASB73_019130 [Starmerella bacillaris]|uniref:Uncharacterized protein n=1 Tax=Starmerella bacillaris TaxID=1247836 RepID=A0AAV5RHS8_STABA|nr:hypothetical protein DASB73_019130 [Starmerella bacillaris]
MSGSNTADKRREDLIIPYAHIPDSVEENKNIVAQSMPMMAIFLKSKTLAWASVLITVTAWLNEADSSEGTPASMNILTSVVSLLVAYMDFVFSPNVVPPTNATTTSSSSSS